MMDVRDSQVVELIGDDLYSIELMSYAHHSYFVSLEKNIGKCLKLTEAGHSDELWELLRERSDEVENFFNKYAVADVKLANVTYDIETHMLTVYLEAVFNSPAILEILDDFRLTQVALIKKGVNGQTGMIEFGEVKLIGLQLMPMDTFDINSMELR